TLNAPRKPLNKSSCRWHWRVQMTRRNAAYPHGSYGHRHALRTGIPLRTAAPPGANVARRFSRDPASQAARRISGNTNGAFDSPVCNATPARWVDEECDPAGSGSQRAFGLLHDGGKAGLVVYGHVGKHLAIELDR